TAAYHKEGADLETLAPGESRTVTVSVRTLREGRLPFTAAALANCVGTTAAKTVTQILTLPALRLEVVDLDAPIRVRDPVVYRISVKNQGTGADRNVTITAALPAEMQFE